MIKLKPSQFSAFLLMLSLSVTSSFAAESNHNAAKYNSQESCSRAIEKKEDSLHQPQQTLNGDEFTLLSWNIEKGANSGWKTELENLTKKVQLVLLQEAIFIDEMKESRNEAVYWSFSPGYKNKNYNSGIMTLSRVQPNLICSLQNNEPWLKTPKISSITRFQIKSDNQDEELSLLLINMHQINFTLGMEAYSRQLEDVASVIESHEGPVIFSGDFNTWRLSRIDFLNKITNDLGLTATSFSPDYRKTAFGHHLDHIYTRGFDIKESHTVQVNTSDHNPLIVTLSLKKA